MALEVGFFCGSAGQIICQVEFFFFSFLLVFDRGWFLLGCVSSIWAMGLLACKMVLVFEGRLRLKGVERLRGSHERVKGSAD